MPDPSPVILDDVVAEAVDSTDVAQRPRISLEVTGKRLRLSILGDEDLLVTALRNLWRRVA